MKCSSRWKLWNSRCGRNTLGQSPQGGGTRADRRDPYSSRPPTSVLSLSLFLTSEERPFQRLRRAFCYTLTCGSTTKLDWAEPQHQVIRSKSRVFKAGDLRNDEIESGYRKDAPRDPQREEGRNRAEVHVLSRPARVRLFSVSSGF